MRKKSQAMLKNTQKVKLAQHAHKFGGVTGLFARVKAALPLNQLKGHKIRNSFLIFLSGIVLWVAINTTISDLINSKIPVKGDNFAPSQVFDGNGNDIQFDENGTIVEDDTTEQELTLLKDTIVKRLHRDANRRNDFKIDEFEISKVVLMPYDDSIPEEDPRDYDRYMLSFFLNANGKTYKLNYLATKNFESTARKQKDFLGDFLSYIKDCAFYDCETMDEQRQKLASSIGADFVGQSYLAYDSAGDECYYIPAFAGNRAIIYEALCTRVDRLNIDPMTALESQIAETGETLFQSHEIAQSIDDLQTLIETINPPAQDEK